MNRKLIYLIILAILSIWQTSYAEQLEKVIPVTIKTIADIAIFPINDVPATVISLNESTLSSEISGNILSIPFQVGAIIEKNQILANLDCANYQFTLNQAIATKDAIVADIELSKWQLSRTEKLAQQNNASQELVKTYAANLKKFNANLNNHLSVIENAENNVNKCSIKSPYNGIITQKLSNLGEYVTPGVNILHLIDIDNLEVEAKLLASEIASLKSTNLISIRVNNIDYPVSIRTILPISDPESRTQIVRLNFIDDKPVPGSPGRLIWKSKTPAIPSEYIRQIKTKLGIFVAQNNKAKFIPIPNALEGQPAIYTGDPNLKIIVAGRYNVTPDINIKIQ